VCRNVCRLKVEQLVGERAAEMKELEQVMSRVDELQTEQKNSRQSIGQLSAQRAELERAQSQHFTDMNELRKVGRS